MRCGPHLGLAAITRSVATLKTLIEFSRASVRDAQRSLTAILEELAENKLALYSAAKDNYPLTGGPSPFLGTVAIFRIVRVDPAVQTSG
ncbi:hypothetical protein ACVW0K_000560 [Streptomyces filamentosus]